MSSHSPARAAWGASAWQLLQHSSPPRTGEQLPLLPIAALPGNGVGLGPREEHPRASTQLLGAVTSWARRGPTAWPAGNCGCHQG